jgi:glutamine synthetase
MKNILEYIWLDANNKFRSKVKVENQRISINSNCNLAVCCLETWNFDGSSTGQANGKDSEVFIKPYLILPNHDNINPNYYYVFCECLNPDGTPHKTNTRASTYEFFQQEEIQNLDPMFGIEQEFFVFNNEGKPIVWTGEPQGEYYCGNGEKNIHTESRNFLDNVIRILNGWNINVSGYNYEVAPGQMEIQICEKGIQASDYLQVLRFILTRCAEEKGWNIVLTPKPELLNSNNWNGSGCHVNFSTNQMRDPSYNNININNNPYNSLIKTAELIHKMDLYHRINIDSFGSENNKLRLSGKNETSSYNTFTYGIANRGCSIRIPRCFVNNLYGYIEDRRPGADMDPYLITRLICSYASSIYDSEMQPNKIKEIARNILNKHLEQYSL